MESRCKMDMVMASTRSGGGMGLRGGGVQVLGYRGFLMVCLLFVTATTFVIDDVHCSISTVDVAPAPKPSTQHIGMFNQYEADALNAVFKKWSEQNPQLSTFLNWSLEKHPCDNLDGEFPVSSNEYFGGAWDGVVCHSELQNATEFTRYYHVSVYALVLRGSNNSCDDDGTGMTLISMMWGFDGILGELPSEISNLTKQESLTINHNPRLTGPVPVEFFQMPSLRNLDLTNNSLNGTLPSHFYNTDCKLTNIALSNNNFNGVSE